MFKKSNIKMAVSFYVFIFVCMYSYSQDKDTRYLKGFCQVFKTKNYDLDYALDMKYSFVVCDGKGTVLDKIAESTNSFIPQKGAGGCSGVRNETNGYNYSLVIIEQDDDRGIFIFDIVMRYKGKKFQAKLKKLVPFDGKKTEIVSFNMNDYVKDPKLLKKLAQHFTKQYNWSMNPPHPLDTAPMRSNMVKAKSKDELRKQNRAPQFKKDSLKKYLRDEAKGLNLKDSTNVERIKRGFQPILFLSRKPIAWEVKPEQKQN